MQSPFSSSRGLGLNYRARAGGDAVVGRGGCPTHHHQSPQRLNALKAYASHDGGAAWPSTLIAFGARGQHNGCSVAAAAAVARGDARQHHPPHPPLFAAASPHHHHQRQRQQHRRAVAAAATADPGGGGSGTSPTSSVDVAAGPSSGTTSGGSGSSKTATVAAADAHSTSSSSAAEARSNGSSGGSGSGKAALDPAERELLAVTSDLPRAEARLERLALWVAAAVAFGGGVWYAQGAEKAQEFFAGYLLEQTLSVDNLFVFVLVFSYFKTPAAYQPKVLTYGLGTAAALRAVMILLGTELVSRFRPALFFFALVLLWSAYGLLLGDGDDDDGDLSDNNIVKFCRRLLPVADAYDGDKFFTDVADPAAPGGARRFATPLLLALAVCEISDVVFAVDSIPAVFGVTLDPFIVYTSNIFAILSLRSLYAFVSTVMAELKYLDKAVAAVLAFIGAKMLAEFGGVEVPADASLLVVGVLLGGGVAASLLLPDDGGKVD